MDVRVLGPIEVWAGTTQLDIGSRRERGLLALLAASADEVVTSDRLVEELWGESAPDRAVRSLYTHVSHLRRALGKDRLVHRGNGYVLVLEPGELDAERFAESLTDARRLLASDPVAAAHQIDDALNGGYDWIDASGRPVRNWIAKAASYSPGEFLTLADAAAANAKRNHEISARIKASAHAASLAEKVGLAWVRYGFRPWLVAVPLLVLGLLCLAQVCYALDRPDSFVPVTVGKEQVAVDDCQESKTTCLIPYLYAADSVVPIDFGQTKNWRPDRDIERGDRLALILNINQVVSWLMAGVLVTSIAGLLKRT